MVAEEEKPYKGQDTVIVFSHHLSRADEKFNSSLYLFISITSVILCDIFEKIILLPNIIIVILFIYG